MTQIGCKLTISYVKTGKTSMNILTQSRTNESGFPQFPRHGSSGKKSNRHWRKINKFNNLSG